MKHSLRAARAHQPSGRLLTACLILAMVGLGLGTSAGMSASVEPATSLTDGNTWNCWANPGGIPCYPQLSGIDMVSADDGWAVGADTFLHWNGAE